MTAGTARGISLDRVTALFDPARVPDLVDVSAGYLDLLGRDAPRSRALGQSVMEGRLYPKVYNAWRPVAGRLAAGPRGLFEPKPERARLMRRFDPRVGATVLDIGCGPGNFTTAIADRVGPAGLVVGLDISPTMLGRAVRVGARENIGYVRADAQALPFPEGRFDAVSCFTALFLMPDPFRALDEMVRVLAPGGRLAVLTSCANAVAALRPAERFAASLAGVTIFGRHEITDALRRRGVGGLVQDFAGAAQVVAGAKPISG
ncbi:methyltransferase domain-containing protein [Nocardia sp. NPDC052566]|uniref:methyltransferase domain-containing protein n=1 Tax=Nocardia sp. NPDC052566 TaxID=3364330 RepID=UPI0037C7C10F